MAKLILFLGVLFGLLAVIAGASEHAVEQRVEVAVKELPEEERLEAKHKRLGQYETGVRYQMYNALALIGLGLVSAFSARGQTVAFLSGIGFIGGIVLFSGSLYLVSALQVTSLTIVVPFGGVSMILGWVLFAVTVLMFDPLIDLDDLDRNVS